jgi:hypothetical protein
MRFRQTGAKRFLHDSVQLLCECGPAWIVGTRSTRCTHVCSSCSTAASPLSNSNKSVTKSADSRVAHAHCVHANSRRNTSGAVPQSQLVRVQAAWQHVARACCLAAVMRVVM